MLPATATPAQQQNVETVTQQFEEGEIKPIANLDVDVEDDGEVFEDVSVDDDGEVLENVSVDELPVVNEFCIMSPPEEPMLARSEYLKQIFNPWIAPKEQIQREYGEMLTKFFEELDVTEEWESMLRQCIACFMMVSRMDFSNQLTRDQEWSIILGRLTSDFRATEEAVARDKPKMEAMKESLTSVRAKKRLAEESEKTAEADLQRISSKKAGLQKLISVQLQRRQRDIRGGDICDMKMELSALAKEMADFKTETTNVDFKLLHEQERMTRLLKQKKKLEEEIKALAG